MTKKGVMWLMAALLAMSSCGKEDNLQDNDKDGDAGKTEQTDGNDEENTPGGDTEENTPGGDTEENTPGGDTEENTPGGDTEENTPGGDTGEGPAAEIDIFPDLEYDKLVFVEGGTFFMGAQGRNPNEVNYDAAALSEESPVHEVTLDSYYIGKYEVTQKLWKKVMGVNPSSFRGDDLPVEWVSWNDCQEFIAKLNGMTGKNYRLPTEAEWEYAARGGQQDEYTRTRGQSGTYYKYAGSNDIEEVAWYNINDPNNKTHTVGSKAPNALGLYDMSGNVWEWCGDWYTNYSSTSETNPTGPSSGTDRVIRGGSYYYDDYYNRVSYRIGVAKLDHRRQYYGLRLVLPLK